MSLGWKMIFLIQNDHDYKVAKKCNRAFQSTKKMYSKDPGCTVQNNSPEGGRYKVLRTVCPSKSRPHPLLGSSLLSVSGIYSVASGKPSLFSSKRTAVRRKLYPKEFVNPIPLILISKRKGYQRPKTNQESPLRFYNKHDNTHGTDTTFREKQRLVDKSRL